MTGACTLTPPSHDPSSPATSGARIETRCADAGLAQRVTDLLATVGDDLRSPVVVVDGGPEQVAAALADDPGRAVVVLSDRLDRLAVGRLVGMGAAAVLGVEDFDADLPCAVRAAAAGYTVVPRGVRQSVSAPALSFREKQVLGMVVLGLTNAEIGARLYLAESTVKSHLTTLFAKLGVRSRKEAAALALEPGGALSGLLGLAAAHERLDVALAP